MLTCECGKRATHKDANKVRNSEMIIHLYRCEACQKEFTSVEIPSKVFNEMKPEKRCIDCGKLTKDVDLLGFPVCSRCSPHVLELR